MGQNDIISGIDIGSTTIRVVVGQKNREDGRLNIIGAAENPAEGVNKGLITSIEDAVSSISGALEKAERMTGIPIEHAYVGINGAHLISQHSHGVVAVSKADGEIQEDDVDRVVEAAQTVATPPNYEILHVIPLHFTVDDQKNIKDPVGMTGLKLEVDCQIILGLTSNIKNLTKCVYRTSVDIDDLVLGVLATAEAVLSKRQKELGVALLCIGGSTTNVVVYEEGDVIHHRVLPVGSGHITNDIAIGFRTSVDIAEKIKMEFGSANPEDISKREVIDLHKIDSSEEGTIPRKEVAEYIEARLEEIFRLVQKELKAIGRAGLLPSGIVLTGGGARLPGIIEAAKKEFRLPAAIGFPREVVSAIDRVNDPTFTTAIGLVLWGYSGDNTSSRSRKVRIPNFSSVSEVTGRMTKWFKTLLP